MAIANVALTDTFDEWRTKTNQLINVYDETNALARASYNATNLAVVTAANISANIISGNSAVYTQIYDNANTITYNVLTTSLTGFYDASNASFDRANASQIVSNTALIRANAAQLEANTAKVIANLAYDTANTFVSNSSNIIADILASNTIIQNTINTTATIILEDFLANADFTFAYNTANAAFDKANSANVLAFNTGIGANAFTSSTIAGANAYANLVWSRSNSFTSATIAGANTAVGAGANAFTSATVSGANTIAIAAFNRANSTLYSSNVVISVADNTNAALRITQTGNGHAILVEDAANPDSTPFIVDANGNVGIGNTNPSQKLTVQGAILAYGITSAAQTSAASFDFNTFANDARILSWGPTGVAGGIGFWTGAGAGSANQYMRITGDGNVGVRRGDPGYALDVVGTVNASAVLVNGAPLTGGGGGTTITIQQDSLDAVRYIAFVNNTTGNASTLNVSTSGLTFNPSTGTLSATVFNSTSDINKKTDITDIDNAIEKVLSLRGVGFKWKDNGLQSYGLIAQEVEKILPDLVDTTNDTKSINYSGLIAFLIEAIKELNDKIENK